MFNSRFIKQTQSTNSLLREMMREHELPEGYVIRTDFQTAGKGQKGNSWESERGKNLLFSLVLYPNHIAVNEQFIVSQLLCLAIKNILDKFSSGFSIKWPNDIYWNDKKIGGILIENILQGGKIKSTIIGIGLNINQKNFYSDAPNPVSLIQIIGRQSARKPIMNNILNEIIVKYNSLDYSAIRNEYFESLYRNEGFHPYRNETGSFEAKILKIQNDGKLVLEMSTCEQQSFYFKEVEFVIG